MHVDLTANQYLEFIQGRGPYAQRTEINSLEVTGHFIVPPKIKKLPDIPTIFVGAISATGVQLQEFNCSVIETARFYSVPTLQKLGPLASFSTLSLHNTGVELLDCTADNCIISDNPKLSRFGPNAKFRSLDISSKEIILLTQLKELPNVVTIHETKRAKRGYLDSVILVRGAGGIRLSNPAQIRAVIAYAKLTTLPLTTLLTDYEEITNALPTLEILLQNYAPYPKGDGTEVYNQARNKLLKEVTTKLTALARGRIDLARNQKRR